MKYNNGNCKVETLMFEKFNGNKNKWKDLNLSTAFMQKGFVFCLVSQLCLTFCDPMDYSPPGSSVHGILQARILEFVATPSSRGCSQLKNRTWVSCIGGKFFTPEPPEKPEATVASFNLTLVRVGLRKIVNFNTSCPVPVMDAVLCLRMSL